MKIGLLSVTFRQLSVVDIIRLVSEAGLQAIEWGSDVHVPVGNFKTGAEVGRMTRAEGIEVASYGSYYSLGNSTRSEEFSNVLETAIQLQAPSIRVWAGNRGSDVINHEWRYKVVEDAKRIADLAQKQDIKIDFEYHKDTLTDCTESAIRLLQEIDRPNVRCNWQTSDPGSYEESTSTLLAICPYLANVHVFHSINGTRHDLSDGKNDWMRYISNIRQTGKSHYLMLEFVKGDTPDQFKKDAKILSEMVKHS